MLHYVIYKRRALNRHRQAMRKHLALPSWQDVPRTAIMFEAPELSDGVPCCVAVCMYLRLIYTFTSYVEVVGTAPLHGAPT